MAEIRVTQNVIEALEEVNANARATQEALEVLEEANANIRTTQVVVEALISQAELLAVFIGAYNEIETVTVNASGVGSYIETEATVINTIGIGVYIELELDPVVPPLALSFDSSLIIGNSVVIS